jgi:acetolactate decarboxylase
MLGVYDGSLSIGQLKPYGDFGLGTFDKLDGELLALNGQFYQITADGKAKAVTAKQTSPFVMLSFFQPQKRISLDKPLSCPELYALLDELRASANVAVAIKLTGHWTRLKTRSVRAQQQPYPALKEAVAGQAVFDFENVKASLVGFWLPSYLAGLNSEGYHFHALTEDKKSGGHVLDCQTQQLVIELDSLNQFQLLLPAGFESLNLSAPVDALKHP